MLARAAPIEAVVVYNGSPRYPAWCTLHLVLVLTGVENICRTCQDSFMSALDYGDEAESCNKQAVIMAS
ncbi:predicted protein [Lichtheimia corymbifera JMRC:FSU:9682]|uniref:Uncharacterized protein n=1 Tax=Lichtheimia corymbifera JMRC:FSU:9682 TaxID=1263082 RepID=A0A068SBL0_9FUNG|nr:predicted protein [Lichtheimia corymbifera JMRC:FSU:9682]